MPSRRQGSSSRFRRRGAVAPPDDLTVHGALRAWQDEALDSWICQGMRGIVAAATGTGKTALALAGIARFWQPGSRVAIIVPSITLQRQWVAALATNFGLEFSQIGALGGNSTDLREAHGFVVCVINSARNGLEPLAQGWRAEGRRVMVVVDECHWAAATANSEAIRFDFDAALGLSATPERSDDGLEEVLIPQLGQIVYRYSLRSALDDGLLAPLTCWNLHFDLTASEHAALEPLELRIRRIELDLLKEHPEAAHHTGLALMDTLARLSGHGSGTASLRELYVRRASLFEATDGRRAAIGQIARLLSLRSRPTLIFHERIEEARKTAVQFENAGIHAALELSTDPQQRRSEALRDFKSGAAQALIAVRTLDEGVDIPKAKIAVIVAGSSSTRQRLQRIGRVARPTGDSAHVITLVARGTSEETTIEATDRALVGNSRVRSVSKIEEVDLLQ